MSNVAYANPAREVVSLALAHPMGEFPVLVVDTRTAEHEADDQRFVEYLTRDKEQFAHRLPDPPQRTASDYVVDRLLKLAGER